MKTTTLCCLALLLLTAGPAAVWAHGDDDPHIERHFAFAFATGHDGDMVRIELDEELDIGETRQFWQGDTEVVITRTTETSYSLTVDGETHEIEIPALDGGHDVMSMMFIESDCEDEGGDCDHQVDIHKKVIKVLGDGDPDVRVFTVDADAAHGMTWVDGEEGVLHLGHDSAVARLLASGVLDKVDAETRAEILKALEGDGAHGGKRVLKIKKGDHGAETVIIKKGGDSDNK